jgi:hypothetical protein
MKKYSLYITVLKATQVDEKLGLTRTHDSAIFPLPGVGGRGGGLLHASGRVGDAVTPRESTP